MENFHLDFFDHDTQCCGNCAKTNITYPTCKSQQTNQTVFPQAMIVTANDLDFCGDHDGAEGLDDDFDIKPSVEDLQKIINMESDPVTNDEEEEQDETDNDLDGRY